MDHWTGYSPARRKMILVWMEYQLKKAPRSTSTTLHSTTAHATTKIHMHSNHKDGNPSAKICRLMLSEGSGAELAAVSVSTLPSCIQRSLWLSCWKDFQK